MGVVGCSSRSVLPDVEEVRVSREAPDPECVSLGKVSGKSFKVKATEEDAMADLKNTVVRKGGNFVQVKEYSNSGATVTGEAFECP